MGHFFIEDYFPAYLGSESGSANSGICSAGPSHRTRWLDESHDDGLNRGRHRHNDSSDNISKVITASSFNEK